MTKTNKRTATVALAICVSLIGCAKSEDDSATEMATSVTPADVHVGEEESVLIESADQLTPVQQQQHQTALAAKDALMTKLSGRLVEAIQKDGPAAAIDVCKSEAPAIAENVKRDFRVDIGRTSFKRRRSRNPSPDWATEFVKARAETPRLVSLPADVLGVLLPIRLQKKCLLCHGPEDQLADDVKATLKVHYPNDQATGFHEDDLRGWFWVEVPYPQKI